MIVDAVGVTESELVDTAPLDRKPTVPLEKLLKQVVVRRRATPTSLSSIAARLARLDRQLGDGRPRRARGRSPAARRLKEIASATRRRARPRPPARRRPRVRRGSRRARPSTSIAAAARSAARRGGRAARRRTPSCASGSSTSAGSRADDRRDLRRTRCSTPATRPTPPTARGTTVESFEQFIEDNKDEITALQVLYSPPPAAAADLRARSRSSPQAIGRPPHRWTPEPLWKAYETLDHSKVRGSGERVLTDLVSLVRFALHQEDELVAVPRPGRASASTPGSSSRRTPAAVFTAEQLAWLERIRDHIAAALAITTDDFDYAPFAEAGGLGKAAQVFGDELGPLLDELNEVLAA